MKVWIVVLSNGEVHYVETEEKNLENFADEYTHSQGVTILNYTQYGEEVSFGFEEFVMRGEFSK